MKIVKQTPTKVSIRDGQGNPKLFGSILIVAGLILMLINLYGGVTLAVVGLLIAVFIEEVILSVDKTLDRVTLKRQSMVSTKVIWEHQIQEIREVRVKEYKDSDDSLTYRINLLLTGGEQIPLYNFDSFGKLTVQKIVDRVQAYLNL